MARRGLPVALTDGSGSREQAGRGRGRLLGAAPGGIGAGGSGGDEGERDDSDEAEVEDGSSLAETPPVFVLSRG